MELTTTQETAQPIFGRTHLTLTASFEASVPSRGVITQRICEDRDVKPELVVIRTIKSRFGGGHAIIDAYVYEDAERLARIESEHLLERTKKTMAAPQAPAETEEAPQAAEPEAEPAQESTDAADEKKE